METTSKLTPQEGCSLAAVLYPEEFKTNRARAIVKALLWLAEAVGEPTTELLTPARNPLVARLDLIVAEQGLETFAGAIGVSPQTIRSWQRGVVPSEPNRKRIEQFLSNQTSPFDAAGAKSGELFGQQQPPEPKSPELSKVGAPPP